MRLRSLTLRGVTRFTGADPVIVDLDELGPGLVAVVGANGAGKTTVLESCAAALYKSFPSRPGWYEVMHGRDAFIEAVFDDGGRELKVRLAVDADRRMTEGYLWEDGRSVTTGRAAEFEAEVARRFGSAELFLASVFSAQNKAGNFLLMRKADRKALFVELLGLGALEVLHEAAKGKCAQAAEELSGCRTVQEAAEAEIVALPDRQIEFELAQRQASAAQAHLEASRGEEGRAIEVLAVARAAAEKLKALEEAKASAARELAAAQKALAEAEARPEKIAREAAEKVRFLEGRKVQELAPRARRRHQEQMAGITARREQLEAALANVGDEGQALAEVAQIQRQRSELVQRQEARLELRRKVTDAEAALTYSRRRLGDATAAREKERERLQKQANLMLNVPCTQYPEWYYRTGRVSLDGFTDDAMSEDGKDLAGTCPLLADARGARERLATLEHAGVEEVDAGAAVIRAGEVIEQLIAEASAAEALAARDEGLAEQLDAREQEARDALARVQAAATARDQLSALARESAEALARFTEELQEAERAVLEAYAERLKIDQDKFDALFEAEAAIDLARDESSKAAGRMDAADKAARREKAPAINTATLEVQRATQTREHAEQAVRGADVAVARARAAVEALASRKKSLTSLAEKVRGAQTELGDWALLERALGRDGVQALEIDAAGPEVAALTNELLAACYGPRFSISFETLREKKSARGEYSEAFDVRVFDAGAERAVEALSGGEKVVVGEAIGLAISIFNARKSGIRWETLFRDETAGALDPENAQAYVLMLRRARELGGFHQVVFVSHSPEVWEAADVRLVVAGGRVTIESERRAA